MNQKAIQPSRRSLVKNLSVRYSFWFAIAGDLAAVLGYLLLLRKNPRVWIRGIHGDFFIYPHLRKCFIILNFQVRNRIRNCSKSSSHQNPGKPGEHRESAAQSFRTDNIKLNKTLEWHQRQWSLNKDNQCLLNFLNLERTDGANKKSMVVII